MARLCRERAEIVANYAQELAMYDQLYAIYEIEHAPWQAQFDAWWADQTGTVDYPWWEEPMPPDLPGKPYSWIEV